MTEFDRLNVSRAEWIRKWVPEQLTGVTIDKEQYRFTLARARAAEAELRVLQDAMAYTSARDPS